MGRELLYHDKLDFRFSNEYDLLYFSDNGLTQATWE